MTNGFITIQFDKSHISTIGERLYTQSLDLIRELVANAYDADATEIRITINIDSIAVEDNGAGMDKEGLGQYFTIGSTLKRVNPLSEKYKRIRIGEFGIGKFAVLSICNRFEIYTRSLNFAATLIFDREDFEKRRDWNIPFIEHEVKEAKGSGTRVTLFQIRKAFPILDLERHLTNIFPLNDKNFSIYINGVKLQSRFIPGERFRIAEETKYGSIRGEIIISSLMLSAEAVGIGIRVKNVLIKRDTFNIERFHSFSVRRLTGEIHADFLPITTNREDFIKDSLQYGEFISVMEKKLRRVIKSLEKSAVSYQDKKAEKVLSDALVTIREALKKNKDILILEDLPLFTKTKKAFAEKEKIGGSVIGKTLSQKSNLPNEEASFKEELKKALSKLRPKTRSRVKTLLRDKHKVIKKIKIGGNEFLVSFAHLGKEAEESFVDGGIVFINRDSRLLGKVEEKVDLMLYHLIRLISGEIVKLTSPKNLQLAFDWQGKLIQDAFLGAKEI